MLIQRYHKKTPFVVRFVDDFFGIALVGGKNGLCKNEWSHFKNVVDDFGILTWDVDEALSTVDSLDLAIKINDGYIITRTSQKRISLYQYITPNSAHPPGMIKGMIHGLI